MRILAGLSVLCLIATTPAHAAGPSFDCAKPQNPSERIICKSPSLADAELSLVQSYYSLRQQAGEPGWPDLKIEILDFQRNTLLKCGVPASGPLPADTAPMASCLEEAYRLRRVTWLARLSGEAAEEARRPADQNVALQRDLQQLGLLPAGRIDGVFGAATRAAVVAWQQSRGSSDNGFLGDADAAALEGQVKKAGAGVPPAPPESPNLGMISYGSKLGEAPIVMKKGIGTASAMVAAVVGWNEYVRQCEGQYDADNPQDRKDCLAFYKAEFKGPKRLTATANCATGEFTDFYDRHLTFAGEREEKYGDSTFMVPVITYEGFELPDSGFMDTQMSGAQFKAMCPAGRPLGEPLPGLHLPSCEDQEFADSASKTAFNAGFSRVMHVTVIDVWDLKSVESVWNKTECRAKITLNTGRDMILSYSAFPRHGKIFISARAE